MDNWKHRSASMTCRTCMWYAPKVVSTEQYEAAPVPDASGAFKAVKTEKLAEVPSTLGRCRRRAPTLDGFPAVFETDWCGDHKLDETRKDL